MSYRLVYSPGATRQIESTPVGLAECIRYHFAEMERSEGAPGGPLAFPFPPGMGFFFRCTGTDGTVYQFVARYRFGQDEESLEIIGLGYYPLANLPES